MPTSEHAQVLDCCEIMIDLAWSIIRDHEAKCIVLWNYHHNPKVAVLDHDTSNLL